MNRMVLPALALLSAATPLVVDSALKGAVLMSAALLSALLLWRAYDCSVNGVSDAVCVRSTHAYYIITHSNHDMHTHRTNIAVSIVSSP